jgi:chromosome segregation ATPase
MLPACLRRDRCDAASTREGDRDERRTTHVMPERNLAAELTLLATEVDSLAKALALANAERAREGTRRMRADATAEGLRQQLAHARRRAKTAERELAKLSANIEATAHSAQVSERELRARLQQAQQANEQLRQEVERKERERRALEVNLREVLENLRNAAQEARGSRVTTPTAVEEATLVPAPRDDGGW